MEKRLREIKCELKGVSSLLTNLKDEIDDMIDRVERLASDVDDLIWEAMSNEDLKH
ncbi:MAG: hypothetical protein ACTSPL_04245 [Candidatus Odinarchaeia archaeon]